MSRLFPFFGVSIAAALLAHKHISDLPAFAYALAVYAVVAAIFSTPLAVAGNIVHAHGESGGQGFFGDGFKVALVFSACSLLCSVAVLFLLSAVELNTATAGRLYAVSAVYVLAIPLLVVNTYLHVFHESTGAAGACASIKRKSVAVGCAFLIVSFFVVDDECFVFSAMGYFLLVEVLVLMWLIKLSWGRKLCFVYRGRSRVLNEVVLLGGPMAAGLVGQKLYYYLLNEKLLSVQEALVGELSICMSVIGCLSIPLVAFSQLHSVYVSKMRGGESNLYVQGFFACTLLIATVVGALSFSGALLFYVFGGGSLEFTAAAFGVMAFFVLGSGYLMAVVAHLRALNDTLVPQVLVNAIMLGVLLPVMYFFVLDGASIYLYLSLQAAAMLVAAAILQGRLYLLCKVTHSDDGRS
ncbi:MAG TPA: hypothetical protein VGE28_12525 [Pseudomonas sp.]